MRRELTACLLLAAAVNAVDVGSPSRWTARPRRCRASPRPAAPPPRMNPRHNNPKDWAAQADASAKALNALEPDQNKVVPSAATGDSGAAAAQRLRAEGDADASEKEPLVESGVESATFRGAVAAFLSEKGLAPDEAMAASELREAQYAGRRRHPAGPPPPRRLCYDERSRMKLSDCRRTTPRPSPT